MCEYDLRPNAFLEVYRSRKLKPVRGDLKVDHVLPNYKPYARKAYGVRFTFNKRLYLFF